MQEEVLSFMSLVMMILGISKTICVRGGEGQALDMHCRLGFWLCFVTLLHTFWKGAQATVFDLT